MTGDGGPAGRVVFIWSQLDGDCSGCAHRIERGMQAAAMTDGTYRHRICVDRWEVTP